MECDDIRLASRNLLATMLNDRGLNGNGVEIGVATAKFSEIWIPACNLSKVYLIDPWKEYGKGEYMDGNNHLKEVQDKRYAMVQEKMSVFGDRVSVLRKESLDVVDDFEDGFFDFIYIDANHEYKWVKKDLFAWFFKLAKGGIFSGHDYVNNIGHKPNRLGEHSVCGVKSAVDEFCDEIGSQVGITGGSRRIPPSWYFVKE